MNTHHPTTPMPLPAEEVHLWYVYYERLTDDGLLARYHALLSDEERARQRRFIFEKHRHRYLVSHAMVRTVLSCYAEVDPAAWQFVTNRYGRPEIDAPHKELGLRFNLSHTEGVAVVAVASGKREIGADVEDTARPDRGVDVAARFFSPGEVRDLRALPADEQRLRFFDYWTLKEAYIKARGMGLSIPLAQFSYHLAGGAPPRISFDPRLVDDPRSWQFAQSELDHRYRIALAVRRRGEPDLRIAIREAVPLVTVPPTGPRPRD